jgi:hypothetical protein
MRCLAVLALLALTACRTRLSDRPDLEIPPPDFTIPLDLSLPPDLLPPPDLTPPFYCRPIYVVDALNQELSGFIPELAQFKNVGMLDCPGVVDGATPDTMSIDLSGKAWVLYTNGSLFTVDLETAACSPTLFDPRNINPNQSDPMTWQVFGSSFSLNAPGATDETLWIDLGTDLQLAAIDPITLSFTRGPKIPNYSELTGTALAELWLFAPAAQPSYIARVDKQTGQLDLRIPVPQVTIFGNFAFAFWGGSFWIFNGDGPIQNGQRTTTVYRVDENTHQVTTVLKNTGRHIVGAGVSGCAPLGLDH